MLILCASVLISLTQITKIPLEAEPLFKTTHTHTQTNSYTFDSKYRMTSFRRNANKKGKGGTVSSRTLDGADNMTSFSDEGDDKSPVIDVAPNSVNQYSDFDGKSRSHDDNGNLRNDGDKKFVFDYQNRLVEVLDQGDALIASYTYTTSGQRVLKDVGGNVTRYLYNGWQVLEERDDSDIVLRQYVDGRGIDTHIQMKNASGDEYYYHTNSQGFVGALTDVNENVVEYYTYSFFPS